MTTGERLVDISTLTTGSAMEHFLNISTGAGVTVLIEQKLIGVIELNSELKGILTSQNELIGTIELNIQRELIGSIEFNSELTGELTTENQLIGILKCNNNE